MEFIKKFNDVLKHDELIGGLDTPLEVNNIKVAQDAELKRGDLLAAENFQGVFKLATAADTDKVFAVAIEDFKATAEDTVTQGYISGRFNRGKLNPNDAEILKTLEPAMRRQEIKLSELKAWYEEAY